MDAKLIKEGLWFGLPDDDGTMQVCRIVGYAPMLGKWVAESDDWVMKISELDEDDIEAAQVPDDRAEFRQLVNSHDLTYAYSDDGSVWRAGEAQYDRIRKLAKDIPAWEVACIWGAMVDRFLVPNARKNFYWKVT